MNRTHRTAGTWRRRSLVAAAVGLFAAALPLSSATAAVRAPAFDPSAPVGGTAHTVQAALAGKPKSVSPRPPTRSLPLSASGKKAAAEPDRTVGILSYDIPGGGTGNCSAAVVTSKNRNLIVTAGHCVYTRGKGYNLHFLFAPGWDGGPTVPYGKYDGIRGWVNKGYAFSKNLDYLDYDYGFVVLNATNQGVQVEDAVGANGIEANYPFEAPRTVNGYVGVHQHVCFGQTRRNQPIYYTALTIDCPGYLRGSSGGPWLDDYNVQTAIGTVNSVNSTLPSETDNSRVIGPYFDDATWSLYQTALS